MGSHMKNILFISHDASRTGAPIVLLNFLEWLKQQGNYELTVYLKHGGELEDSFKQLANTHIPLSKTLSQRIVKRIIKSSKDDAHALPGELLKQSFDAVYLNTVVCLDMAPGIKSHFKCPVICHVHENDFTIKYYYPAIITAHNLQQVDHFIAASESTRQNMIDNYVIPADKISLVYEFIPLNKIKQPTIPQSVIKQELSLSNEFIIGGSGLTIWRKGIDLFIQLAVQLNKLWPANNVKFIWVGALTYEFECQYNYEAERLGIMDKIIFTGSKPSPQNYFQLFDVFVLTSREDPFPLVAIEAASLNKPIICFENAGGMPEFVTDGQNGLVIPYADTHTMAVKILELINNPDRCSEMGERAANLIADFDINVAAPKLVQVIDQLIAKL
jgi:glycosyltransferase involved in cell wall biosynthesis